MKWLRNRRPVEDSNRNSGNRKMRHERQSLSDGAFYVRLRYSCPCVANPDAEPGECSLVRKGL